MSKWYHKIVANQNDFAPLTDALEYFEKEYEAAQKQLDCKGTRIKTVSSNLPGIAEQRFGQLQEIEAILVYMELLTEKAHSEAKRNLMENYNRSLTDRQATQYAQADQKVFDLKMLCNEVALVRNKFLSLTKGIEYLHFQIGHITKLHVAGIEDATL